MDGNRKETIKRYSNYVQNEQNAAFVYEALFIHEENPAVKKLYKKLMESEIRHAIVWSDKLKELGVPVPKTRIRLQSRIFTYMAKKYGSGSVVGHLARIEGNAVNEYEGQVEAEAQSMKDEEASHARIFNFLSKQGGQVAGPELARIEGRHKTGGNALRAGVLGANDGLVSIFCLVMGVVGANLSSEAILITGLAGLIAGALSMALGEFISVQSNREQLLYQLKIEADELSQFPEEEKEELALIYQTKGMSENDARKLADTMLSDKNSALDTLAREELGIDPKELGGSAWVAAISSFILFMLGGIFPVLPFIFASGSLAIILSSVSGALGLFLLGAASAIMTGGRYIFSGIRMVIFGLIGAGITYVLGHLLGISL